MDERGVSDQRKPGVGLREAHAHLPWLGKALTMLSLEGCASAGEALDRIGVQGGAMAGIEPSQWLLGQGARVESWREARWFARWELDRVTGARPAAVMSFDHHAVFANSAALALGGIGRGTPDPAGGVIERDGSGEPTGLLLESAAFALWARAPEAPEGLREGQIRGAVAHLRGLGFEEIHDLYSPAWLGPVLARLHDSGDLRVRVGLYGPLEEIESHHAARTGWERDGLRLLGGKIFTDGTLNSRTAWVLEPYARAPAGMAYGKALLTPGQIGAAIDRCAGLGLGIAMHAIGDGAVRACLDGVERSSPSLRAARFGISPIRIEHCEMIDEADVARFARLNVVASVQPCHLLADIEALRRGLPHRLHRVMPWRDLIEAGLRPGTTLLFGSDVPVVRADPEDSVQGAVERRRAGAAREEAIAPEQAITREQALACFACAG
jgi:predicted amidohydrolase YtcJ